MFRTAATGTSFPQVTESDPPRFSADCITNIAWKRRQLNDGRTFCGPQRGEKSNSQSVSTASMLPARGFEYFFSPDSDADEDIIAHLFIYCLVAVAKWPEFRRHALETAGLSSEQCDHLEKNAIQPLSDVRDTIQTAIDTGNFADLSRGPVADKLLRAHATLAMYAADETLVAYRGMIFGGQSLEELPSMEGFIQSLWEIKGSDGSERFAEVIRRGAHHNQRLHDNDGRNTSEKRRDRIVAAIGGTDQLQNIEPLFDPMHPMEPLHKPEALKRNENLPLTERQLASFRQQLRALGRRRRLTTRQTDLLVRLALDGGTPGDDPSACRAIRGRKIHELLPEVQAILASLRSPKTLSAF